MKPDPLFEMRCKLDQMEAMRLSPHACLSRDAIRRRPEESIDKGHRQHFSLDADRVMHSLAYTRYIDKTQVFSLLDNDHVTHRVLHVQLVSKIARTVGRFLGLNEDLIEAIALAHDIGHPPFGHDGETYLAAKCREHGLGGFMHNLQSVHFLERVENGGRGLNLSLQVLDGVLCHDGEVHSANLAPKRGKGFADMDAEIHAKLKDPKAELIPMTLEGCVVRIADTVAYIGRDLEDAIQIGLLRRSEVPKNISQHLGDSNGTIVYRLVSDLLAQSLDKPHVAFSPQIGQALRDLKAFNLERIYLHPKIKTGHKQIEAIFARLFDEYMDDMAQDRRSSPVFVEFLDQMDNEYLQMTPPAKVVRDFIAGMTDEHLLRSFKDLVLPARLPSRFDILGHDPA